MSGEEAMVLGHIQASGNEGILLLDYLWSSTHSLPGIWTKHLKAKTELHQTVIDRCLKSLVQKHLVKSIKAVRVCLVYSPSGQIDLLITFHAASNAKNIHACPP